MNPSLLISNVRLADGRSVEIAIAAGRIGAISANLPRDANRVIEDGADALVLPGFVDGHTHLDKTNWGLPWYRNNAGPKLVDRIENERS